MARQDRDTTRKSSGRRSRGVLGKSSLKMAVAPIKGYHQHWFNDDGNRIQDAVDNDYEFVTTLDGEREVNRTKRVGVKEDGTPLHAVLMKKKDEWHAEDQAEKAKEADLIDEAIKAGKPADGVQDRQAFYGVSKVT